MAACARSGLNLLILSDDELRFIHDIMWHGVVGVGRRNLSDSIADSIRKEYPEWAGHIEDMSDHVRFE